MHIAVAMQYKRKKSSFRGVENSKLIKHVNSERRKYSLSNNEKCCFLLLKLFIFRFIFLQRKFPNTTFQL